MNKLGREHVKNNLKWIYVQPTSSSLKIDGLGPVLSCVLFSSPYPVPERAGCCSQGGKGASCCLMDTPWPVPAPLCLCEGLSTRVPAWPGAGGQITGCQDASPRALPNVPAPLLSGLEPKYVCAVSPSLAAQAHSLAHGGGPEAMEKALPAPRA